MLAYGSLSAQEHYEFNYHDFANKITVIAQININGVEQTSSDYEIGAFDGTTITGSERIGVYGSNNYHRAYLSIYFNTAYDVTFKLYNHSTGVELTNCTVTYEGAPLTFEWTDENNYGTNKKPVVFNFVAAQSFTKTIIPYTAGGGWNFISSPIGTVAPEDVTNMTSNNFDLYRFNQSSNLEWENYKSTNNYHYDLESGRGYLYANSGNNSGNVTLTFTGIPESGNAKEIPVNYDGNAEFKGWNLIGNPFTEAAYLADAATDGTALAYAKMNETGDGLTIVSSGAPIPAMEGVLYQTTATGNVYFTKTQPTGSKNGNLNITVSQGRSSIDNAVIRFGEGNTLEKYSFRENSTKVYFPQNGKDFALINADNEGEIPVCFKAEANGTYTLDISCENVSMGYLHLIDNLTGNDVDLLVNPNYTFDAKTSDYATRFKLVFATGNANDDQFAFFSDGKLIINNDGIATLQVIDVNGRILSSESISGCCSKSVNAKAGVYMLRLINSDNTKTQKIVVR